MTKTRADELFTAFDSLLEREREALLEGDIEGIGALADEREALIGRLDSLDDGDRKKLGVLRGKADRNRALLENAMRGVRTVGARLTTMRRLGRSFETYDENGARTVVVTRRDGTLERRA